ncbi:hypothetical protein QCA50_010105 [Cerrena zonata]|uniref:Probable beta-glucosidase G n=1 Tax=Cerrena zonata TaxID=2478898 RepID=A0AAW0G4R3_9APHY
MQARGVILGKETHDKGTNMILGPAMDIMRNPKAGRAWESWGPEPYLAGEGAYETIVGIQSTGTMACAKHFILNNQEHFRMNSNSHVDDKAMHEIYFYPFLKAIEANVASVMCSYNDVNGTDACANSAILGDNGLLRKNGFKGFVVSDWFATYANASTHANAGLDMEMPGGLVFGTNLTAAVRGGDVTEATLNNMVRRVLAPYYLLDQDHGYPSLSHRNDTVRSAAHTATVREIAAASSVLLKNSRSKKDTRGLPLSLGSIKSLAVIGEDANYVGQDCGNINTCPTGTFDIGFGSGSNNQDFVVPPIAALKDRVGASKIVSSLTNDTAAASTAAKKKDACLVFVNTQSGEALGMTEIGQTCTSGMVVKLSSTLSLVSAATPSSSCIQLPFSIDEDESAYGTSIVTVGPYPDVDYTEGVFLDYRYMMAHGITPHYAFGFGLSYTTFDYSNLKIKSKGDSVSVSFSVKNSGGVDGTDIPQLYLGFPSGAGEPERVLRGFEEVPLRAGKSSNVEITLTQQDLSVWDVVSQKWVKPKGKFTVYIGKSVLDIQLKGSF